MRKTVGSEQFNKGLRIFDMTAKQARDFLLKGESYCDVELPVYFTFTTLLSAVAKEISDKSLSDLSKSPRDYEGVNYSLLSNKDGRHAWRPFQLIHPAIYVSLVHQITKPDNWETITNRLNTFQNIPKFTCTSIPLESAIKRKDKAAQILNWWIGIEQGSIELAIEYKHSFHADVSECYASIYTHSIAWAVHDKSHAKERRKDRALIGNVIDGHIQDMRHGQTNGIPQGSVLMDLIAELVLGYADLLLSERLQKSKIDDYRILRYRDDYRIFVQNTYVG